LAPINFKKLLRRGLLIHLLLLLHLFALALLFDLVRVMTDGAARDRAEHGVMMGVMAGDGACGGAAETADGLSAADRSEQSSGANRGK
jgi:hypothetical protein